jgi:hypothetical protein
MGVMRDMQSQTEKLFLQSKTLQQEVKRLEALHPIICVLPPAPSTLKRLILRALPPLRKRYNLKIIRGSGLFDADWYLARNKDVVRSGADPALHYLLSGGVEGRDPGPHFHAGHYLKMYPDIKAGRVNPLLHYLKSGRQEGRVIRPGMVHGKSL